MNRGRLIAKIGWIGASATAVAMTSACTTATPPEGQNRVNYGGALSFDVPVMSMLGRKFETVVRQQYDFSCGSAALATLLRFHYEDAQNEQSVFLGMWRNGDRAAIRKLGFSLLDMKRYLADRHIAADGYKVSLAQIAKAKIPGIALINFNGYKHFVVVKGIGTDTVLLGDPSLGLRREETGIFAKQWNGILFVLDARPQIAQRHFNQPADLVRAPGWRFNGEADPLSTAALALTRPVNISPVLTEF